MPVTSFIGIVATGFPVGVTMWIGVSCFVFPSPAKPEPTNAIRDPSGDQHGQKTFPSFQSVRSRYPVPSALAIASLQSKAWPRQTLNAIFFDCLDEPAGSR